MALYEYVCHDCHASFELRRAMGDADRACYLPERAHRRAQEAFCVRFGGGERRCRTGLERSA